MPPMKPSALIFASRITLRHFSVSSATVNNRSPKGCRHYDLPVLIGVLIHPRTGRSHLS
jgi:hypothetical protein